MADIKTGDSKPTKRPASRFAIKSGQPLEATHAGHNPPVHGCKKCGR